MSDARRVGWKKEVNVPSIVGTWKLVGAKARDRDGKPLPTPYGGKGMWLIAFHNVSKTYFSSMTWLKTWTVAFQHVLLRRRHTPGTLLTFWSPDGPEHSLPA
jgi:hypothetical protein